MTTYGIIGAGSFGTLLANQFASRGPVRVYDNNPSRYRDRLEDVLICDQVWVCTPSGAHAELYPRIIAGITDDTIVIDCCSVKSHLTGMGKKIKNWLSIHPLFGPPTDEKWPLYASIVMCEASTKSLENFFKYGWDSARVITKSPEQHDRDMAYIQALPFFVARALVDCHLMDYGFDSGLHTASYEKLLEVAKIETNHSRDLFDTIQSNPFAVDARNSFISSLVRLIDEMHPELEVSQ